MCVRAIKYYVGRQFSDFGGEYLREIEKVRITLQAFWLLARRVFKAKRVQTSHETVILSERYCLIHVFFI